MYLLEETDIHVSLSAVTRPVSDDKFNCQDRCKHWSNLKEVCELLRPKISLTPSNLTEDVFFQHVQIKAGQSAFRMGQPFKMLYIVNSGFLKSTIIDAQGNEQILGFPMKNDLLCMDGIYSNHHVSEAIALSECDLIMIPFKQLVSLARTHREMEGAVYRMMSGELIREQAMRSLLASSSAEARVTRFLLDLSEKFGLLGYSRNLFNLRMTRQELGSYLGLTLETVSRTLSTLNSIGLITVDGKSIELNDINALRTFRKLLPVNDFLNRQQIYMRKVSTNNLIHPVEQVKIHELHATS